MEIKIKQRGVSFSKDYNRIEDEIILRTERFDWYFTSEPVIYSQWMALWAVQKQIKAQYDCNEREQVYNIQL